MKKLIYGVGINDATYLVQPSVDKKQIMCPFYDKWKEMLERCYSSKRQFRNKTYIGCSVADEWLTFSNFKRWMEKQDWSDKQLDKDLLVYGNKVYSPETCVFVIGITNAFITDRGAARGEYALGATFHKVSGKFQAQCSNPFTKKREYLGLFICPNEAHLAWKKRKHELACQLAELQTDSRVSEALRKRYA